MGTLDTLFADLLGAGELLPASDPGESGESGEFPCVTRTCAGNPGGERLAKSGERTAAPLANSPVFATRSPVPTRMQAIDAQGFSPNSPDSPARPVEVDSPRGSAQAKSCRACAHRTRARTCGEPVAAGLLPRFGVVFVADGDGGKCPAWKAAPQVPGGRTARASGPALPVPLPEPWSGTEIARFLARRERLMRWGRSEEEAERIAERLLMRDREQDDRRLCLECARLEASGRCGAAARGALRNADRRLEPLPLILQRCEGFEPSL